MTSESRAVAELKGLIYKYNEPSLHYLVGGAVIFQSSAVLRKVKGQRTCPREINHTDNFGCC